MRENSSLVNKESFWRNLDFFMNVDGEVSFKDITAALSIDDFEVHSYIRFLNEVGVEVQSFLKSGEKMLLRKGNPSSIQIEFSFVEWLKFQSHFPSLSTNEDKPFHESIKTKLMEVEEKFRSHDLFSALPALEGSLRSGHIQEVTAENFLSQRQKISFLEESILDHKVVRLETNGQSLSVFPRKIVFYDEVLNLIGEGTFDGSLVCVSLPEIQGLVEEETQWSPSFSKMEIDDFISSVRLISENSVRLVLKIFAREDFEANLPYQFFENSCLISNHEGDFIWAATIEPNEDIYNWLFSLGQDVEILDPSSIKRDFIKFCENKLKKVA